MVFVTTAGGIVDAAVTSVSAHSGFTTNALKNDIAVVNLDRSVQLGPRINTICLPDGLAGADLPSRFPQMSIIGWGSENTGGGTVSTLREAVVPLQTTAQCEQAYSGISRITIGARDQVGRLFLSM